ncbi:hypothetical protein B0H66DRAFT_173836 [Apodospora peruviana]|uniref:Uncharacterized protein n=1 Tax=Apodospora peruviana TaxID=516989 RepID=A0AAE0M876_9PEZI|nr:hypothetical protein B0H66DRAFT_173836 [Apodospora peruviana]
MGPATPKVKVVRSVGPSSPPQTPTTSLPGFSRQSSPTFRPMPPHNPQYQMAPTLQPVGAGPNFNFTRAINPNQLSPQSSSSSAVSDSESEASDTAPSRPITPARARPAPTPPAGQGQGQGRRTGRIVTQVQAAFTVEELSDFEDSEDERLDVIRPHAIEYAESDRSRSRSRHPPEIDPSIMQNLGRLQCSSDSDESDVDEAEYRDFITKRREEKRRRRMTSGSIGKRTITESIGSGSDREDLKPFLGADEVGSSARRLRRRVDNRRSLQFQDPPPPRIEELDEPESSDDDILISETLARELPYYEIESYLSMEIDSPSSPNLDSSW